MERPDVTDDSPSPSAITLVALLGSLVALLLIGVIVAVGWTAGGGDPGNDSRNATAGLPDLAQELSAQLWVLDSPDSSIATRDANRASLAFHEGRLSGLGPCNAYWAQFSLDEDDESLEVTELRHTDHHCAAFTMRAEREYFAALRAVRDVDLDDRDHLVLTNRVGARLPFDAHDAHDELDGTWRVDQIGRDGRLGTPARGTKPIIFFNADASALAIGTGCNTLRSSWALVDDHLETGAAAQTLAHCDEPELQHQETALAQIMDPGVRVHVTEGRLILLDRHHRILAIATHPE